MNSNHHRSTRANKQAGQTLLPVAFGMVVFGAVLGLAIDLGYLRYLKRELQTATDSAAIAAAAEFNYGDITTAAKTVTVNNPPASGPNQGQAGYIEVLIAKVQPTLFMRIVPGALTSTTITTRAVAELSGGQGCVYTLQSAPGGITIGTASRRGGGASFNASCAYIDNGNMTLLGRADNVSATTIGVAGSFTNGARARVAPTPVGAVSASDPLAYLPTQNPGNCDYTNVSYNSGTHNLFPGVYCGGLQITGTANINFNHGTYVMMPNGPTNNGLIIAGSGNVIGSNVTFYNGAASGAVSITNTNTVSLTASATGAYAGILIFQDPANGNNATVDGGNNPTFQGALYFPNLNTTLSIDNIGNNADYTIIVAGSLDVRGNNNQLGNNYSSLANGSPIRDAVLVE
jgi:Flp pilus assembly protein TadG